VIVFNVYGMRGHWIAMLQNFYSKIIHHFGAKHANIDALNKNLVSMSKEDEDFGNKIQDLKRTERSLWQQSRLYIVKDKINRYVVGELVTNLFTLL
jgi:hypothetical protein